MIISGDWDKANGAGLVAGAKNNNPPSNNSLIKYLIMLLPGEVNFLLLTLGFFSRQG